MSIKIRRTGSRDYGRYVKALICGEPGAGKTLISSTFPNPIYASAEGGLMSIADRNIPYIDIRSSDDLLGLKHGVDQAPEVREKIFGFPVDTVVIDTIDEVQRVLIRERIEETKKETMGLPDWGWLGEQMQAIIRGFRNLELNVVLTAHMKESTDSDTGKVWMKPGLQGAIADQIAAYVDLALVLQTSQVVKIVGDQPVKHLVRSLQTFPDNRHPWVKDRSGKLPREFEVNFDDDYKRLHEFIFGSTEFDEAEETPEVKEVDTRPVTPEPEPEKPIRSNKALVVDPETKSVVTITPQVEEKPVEKSAEDLVCEECGAAVSEDQRDLSRIRWRRVLCREDFVKAGKK